VQQGFAEDGLPALMNVIAVDILRTHQTLTTVRRCRSDGGDIASRRPATLRTCVLHRGLQHKKKKCGTKSAHHYQLSDKGIGHFVNSNRVGTATETADQLATVIPDRQTRDSNSFT